MTGSAAMFEALDPPDVPGDLEASFAARGGSMIRIVRHGHKVSRLERPISPPAAAGETWSRVLRRRFELQRVRYAVVTRLRARTP